MTMIITTHDDAHNVDPVRALGRVHTPVERRLMGFVGGL
jgi:hypothetical protein